MANKIGEIFFCGPHLVLRSDLLTSVGVYCGSRSLYLHPAFQPGGPWDEIQQRLSGIAPNPPPGQVWTHQKNKKSMLIWTFFLEPRKHLEVPGFVSDVDKIWIWKNLQDSYPERRLTTLTLCLTSLKLFVSEIFCLLKQNVLKCITCFIVFQVDLNAKRTQATTQLPEINEKSATRSNGPKTRRKSRAEHVQERHEAEEAHGLVLSGRWELHDFCESADETWSSSQRHPRRRVCCYSVLVQHWTRTKLCCWRGGGSSRGRVMVL